MSRYDGLIIPRSYSEYINKTDAATLQQALQLPGVLSGAVAAGDNKAVTSNAVNVALANRAIVITLGFNSFENQGNGHISANVNLIAYSKTPYILFISLGGDYYKSGVIAFLHPISFYENDSNIQLVTAPLSDSISIINNYSFQDSVLTLSLSKTYEVDMKILLL